MFVLDLNSPVETTIGSCFVHADATAPMTSPSFASSDAATLFSTDAGTATERDDGMIDLSVGEMRFTVSPGELRSMRDAAARLAADVRRCGADCRWQLRTPALERSVIVLESEEVLRLYDLLDGAAAMLDLNDLLDEVGVARV